ncbi:A/G-specific adenine glycosylase [Amaricoccus macauensis]|uniref:A/G-specific adenine glycosylase n=1 Tax=Amaricoccus macauensis TaxID=57001 RepID=UPI003C79D587
MSSAIGSIGNERDLAGEILAWYDRHARDLPWRVPPGSAETPDPYRIWLSEVMLQQTTVAAVRDYFETFTRRWPRVEDLAAAEDGDVMAAWAGLGYYARARNLLKCARVVASDHGGTFPDTEEGLLELPGIGPYTAAAIAAIAFDRPAVVLDGNIERVMARIFAVEEPLPKSKPILRAHAASLTPRDRAGDYAQAVMDLGATICTPRNPACGICPWMEACLARAEGIAAQLPRKARKPAKPVRQGIAWLAMREDGAVLLERRPEKGLLGGMLGLPGSDWREKPPDPVPPFAAEWQPSPGDVRHTFTHFHLILSLRTARVPQDFTPPEGLAFHGGDPGRAMPTVMRKALKLGLSSLE